MIKLSSPIRRQHHIRFGGFGSSGFSLVEVMVGVVLGMLSVLVIVQVYSTSEGRKRSTTGAGDAQSNGAIALYGLQRDIRQSGYGINTLNLLGCSIALPSGKTVPLSHTQINPATSVVPAGDAATDTLLVSYGSTNGQPQGNPISAVSGTSYTVATPAAFSVNDYVVGDIGTCPANLVLDRVTAVSASTVTVTTGAVGVTNLYNLGQTPKILAYAIRNGNLTLCDYVANDCTDNDNWQTIANDIVSLRAQYGVDDPGTGSASTVNYVVDTFNQTTPATSCDWARTPALRVALTARSQQYEKELVTTDAPTWDGGSVTTNNLTAVPIDLSANTDWQHYRYRVFPTIVPLRNITWMGVQAACP